MISAVCCYIACHGASSDHFATFIERAHSENVRFVVYAPKEMAGKFADKNITITSIDDLSSEEEAKKIAMSCSAASVVITDVGHRFSGLVQKALAQYAPEVFRFAYYDNPEPYVPGGYSAVAADVMRAARGVLFANANLCTTTLYQEPNIPIDLSAHKKIGIGYYPLEQVNIITKRRIEEQATSRKTVLDKHAITDHGQKLLVYFGGNNEEYFTLAFPAFLSLITEAMKQSDFSDYIFILQQHPAATKKNIDALQITSWQADYGNNQNAPKIIVSDFRSDYAQVVADGALYYQTSMGPQFVLAGIPTAQIGHNTYEDVLIRGSLIESITTPEKLLPTLLTFQQKSQSDQSEVIKKSLGINTNWQQIVADVHSNQGLTPIDAASAASAASKTPEKL